MTVRRLSRRLTLETPDRVADGAGGYIETWVPRGTVWAEVRPGSGRERGRDFATLSETDVRIFVRGAPPGSPARPAPEDRFREGTRVFHILAVTEADASGAFLMCRARSEVVS